MDDPAPSDLKNDTEYVTFDSGEYGEFSACDRLAMVREVLLHELMDPNAEIFEGTECVFSTNMNGWRTLWLGWCKKCLLTQKQRKLISFKC